MMHAAPGRSAPLTVLLLSALGMLAGLVHDAGRGGVGALGALCGANAGDLLSALRLHFQLLPAMHLGMVAGALWGTCCAFGPHFGHLAAPTPWRGLLHRLAASLACSAWMMAGMTAASIVYRELPAGARGSATMLGGMFVGMVLGMISGMWLGKLPGAALGLANDGPLARRAWMVIGPGRRLGGADPADAASVPDSLV